MVAHHGTAIPPRRISCTAMTPESTPELATPPRPKVVIVMPAYNAARTLERTYADIPHDIVD